MRKLHVAMMTFKEHYPIVWKHWPKKFRRQAVIDFMSSSFYFVPQRMLWSEWEEFLK